MIEKTVCNSDLEKSENVESVVASDCGGCEEYWQDLYKRSSLLSVTRQIQVSHYFHKNNWSVIPG